MKEFPGTHSPARGGRSSSTTPDFAGKERGERRGVMFSEEFLSPLRGSGETGNPSFPGAYATGLMPAALRAGGQKMCVILWVETPGYSIPALPGRLPPPHKMCVILWVSTPGGRRGRGPCRGGGGGAVLRAGVGGR